MTWQDNADNETQFMVMRMEVGQPANYETVGSPPANSVSYRDTSVASGKVYMYMVAAMNEVGQSEITNKITVSIP